MDNILNIERFIDHTLLKPDATEKDILNLCDEAKEYNFFSVCIHPHYIRLAKDALSETGVQVSTVVGFPLGMTHTHVKIYEAMESVLAGADELDMVINIGRAKAHDWDAVEKEISDIITASPEAIHKVIIETCYLSDDEKRRASISAMNSGADFIKTSTGFGPVGATIDDVMLIKNITGGDIGIKASGGIKRLKDVINFIEAGATRIGTSSGVSIMKEIIGY
jgi:deoxyribose-phosphate aldolase